MEASSMKFSEFFYLLKKRWYIVILFMIIVGVGTSHFIKPKYVITDEVNVTEAPSMQQESKLAQLVNYNSALNKAASVVDEKIIKAALEDINSKRDPQEVLKNLRILIRPNEHKIIFQYSTYDDSNWFDLMRSVTYKSIGSIELYTSGIKYKRNHQIDIKKAFSEKQKVVYTTMGTVIGGFFGVGMIFFIESLIDMKRR